MANFTPHHMFREDAIARQNPEGWRWYKLEAINDDMCLVEGAIPTDQYVRGKKAGRLNWDGAKASKCVVSERALLADALAYEAETGCCSSCLSRRHVWAGWGLTTVNRWKVCPRCDGTGVAP